MSPKRAVPMIAAALASLTGGVAHSAPGKARGGGPTAAEFAELKQKVDQQSELLMRLTQLEAEHYEMLIKWIQGNSRPGTVAPAPRHAPRLVHREPDASGRAGWRHRRVAVTGRAGEAGDHHGPRRRQGQAVGADLRLRGQHQGAVRRSPHGDRPAGPRG